MAGNASGGRNKTTSSGRKSTAGKNSGSSKGTSKGTAKGASSGSRSAKGSSARSTTGRKRTANSAGGSAAEKGRGGRGGRQVSPVRRDVTLIVLFALMVFLFLCNFMNLGIVGNFLSDLMFGMTGLMAYFLPVFLFSVYLYYILMEVRDPKTTVKTAALIGLFLIIDVAAEMIAVDMASQSGYDPAGIFSRSVQGRSGGGVIGGTIAFLLYSLLRTFGSVLILIVLTIVCVYVLAQRSFLQLAREKAADAKAARQERLAMEESYRRAHPEEFEDEFEGEDEEEGREEIIRHRGQRAREEEVSRREEQRAREEERFRRQEQRAREEEVSRRERWEREEAFLRARQPREEEVSGQDVTGQDTDDGVRLYRGIVGSTDLSGDEIFAAAGPAGDPSPVMDTESGGKPFRMDSDELHEIRPEDFAGPAGNEMSSRRPADAQDERDPSGMPYTAGQAAPDPVMQEWLPLKVEPVPAEPVVPAEPLTAESVSAEPVPAQTPSAEDALSSRSAEGDAPARSAEGAHHARSVEDDVSARSAGAPAAPGGDISAVSSVPAGEATQKDVPQTDSPQKDDMRVVPVHTEREQAASAGRTGSGRDEGQSRTQQPSGRAYRFPPVGLLKPGQGSAADTDEELRRTARLLQTTLHNFGVSVTMTDISQGPSVTRYEMLPEMGVKVSRIVSLADDIKLALAATDIRIEAPIPGKSAIGIEVPNRESQPVMLRDIVDTEEFRGQKSRLSFAVGKDIAGRPVYSDIAKMPHVLIAGATGSGKSVCINTIIISILYHARPDEVKFIMIDPKVVELSVYNGIPHLLIPVVTDPQKATAALNWAVAEMESRYRAFADNKVRDIKAYNALVQSRKPSGQEKEEGAVGLHFMPQIVVIVDELADLMMVAKNDVETAICRLAQLARAAGIHLIIATQRPSVDVITGLIKANMPSRIAFRVSSGVDSRTILDMNGAEKLLGKGDMLFFPQGLTKPDRIQGGFVSDEEVNDVVQFLSANVPADGSEAEQLSREIDVMASAGAAFPGQMNAPAAGPEMDELFGEAGRFIIEKNNASIGLLQRKYRIGFNRAARIMDQLCEAGVVGDSEGTKARNILMSPAEFAAYCSEKGISPAE